MSRAVCPILAAAFLLLCGCSVSVQGPNLGSLYDRAAQYHDTERNPVIIIPGVLGSRLRQAETDRIVWGAFGPGAANPQTPEGARLVALPMREGASLAELTDDVYSDGALDRLKVSLWGLPVELNAYVHILRTLGVGGFRDQQLAEYGAIDYGPDHFTCFQFDYDWRRDNIENARRLEQYIIEKRQYVQKQYEERFGVKDHDVKFDIVAHSMGGLIARYFLRYGGAEPPPAGTVAEPTWAGAKYVDRVVLLGTPNAGSMKALRQVIDGVRFSPILPTYEAAILGTMPSLYQLLPRSRHQVVKSKVLRPEGPPAIVDDLLDPELWAFFEWGLASADQDDVLEMLLPEVDDPARRRLIAADHLEKSLDRARQFQEALDVPATPPEGTELYLVAGDAVDTEWEGQVTEAGFSVTEWLPGDGTVTRVSALMDERMGSTWQPHLVGPIPWTNVMFLFTDHLGMTRDPAFTDNLLYLLLEQPR